MWLRTSEHWMIASTAVPSNKYCLYTSLCPLWGNDNEVECKSSWKLKQTKKSLQCLYCHYNHRVLHADNESNCFLSLMTADSQRLQRSKEKYVSRWPLEKKKGKACEHSDPCFPIMSSLSLFSSSSAAPGPTLSCGVQTLCPSSWLITNEGDSMGENSPIT